MSSLYEIKEEYRLWQEKAEAAEGVLTEELIAEIEAIEDTAENKAEIYAIIFKNNRAIEKMLEEEQRQFEARRKSHKRIMEAMEVKLADIVKTVLRKDKLETAKCRVSFRKSTAIEIPKEHLPDFIKWAQESGRDDLLSYKPPEPSKTAIKDCLEREHIPFVDLVERNNIQIK